MAYLVALSEAHLFIQNRLKSQFSSCPTHSGYKTLINNKIHEFVKCALLQRAHSTGYDSDTGTDTHLENTNNVNLTFPVTICRYNTKHNSLSRINPCLNNRDRCAVLQFCCCSQHRKNPEAILCARAAVCHSEPVTTETGC